MNFERGRRAILGLCCALFASFTIDFLSGRDKYYYIAQLQEVLRQGHLVYPTTSIAWILQSLPLAWLTVESALRAIVFFNLFACAYLLAALTQRLGGSRLAELWSVALFASANLVVPLATDFVAELTGVTIILSAMVLVAWRPAPSAWSIGLLVCLCFLGHRAAAACFGVFLLAYFISSRSEGRSQLRYWLLFGLVLVAITISADVLTAGARFGRRLGPLDSWLTSSSHREGIAIAFALWCWSPLTSEARWFKAGLVGVSTLVFWNPLLETDSGFNTVGARLGLMAAWILPLVAPLAVSHLFVSRSRTTAALVALTLFVVNSWPQHITTVSSAWAARRDILDHALGDQSVEFHRGAPQVAEHGIQFLIRARTGETAISDFRKADQATASWWWLTIPDDVPRFSSGFWITEGWVQVPEPSLKQWLSAASPTQIRMLTMLNPQLRLYKSQ